MSTIASRKTNSHTLGRERAPARTRTAGTRCIWPTGVLERYGISYPTLWRWERAGKLPPRDVYVGGKAIGWRPETLEAAERGQSGSAT